MKLKPFKRIVAELSGLANATLASYRSTRITAYSADGDSLRARFNSDKGKVRLLALLSPTCGFCLSGASEIRKLLDKFDVADTAVYSVWVPILASDATFTVGRATKLLSNDGVAHYWDSAGTLAEAFADVLGLGDAPAWDVYLLYDQGAEWLDKPPKPIFWQEQLRISDETKLNADKLAVEIQRLTQHRNVAKTAP